MTDRLTEEAEATLRRIGREDLIEINELVADRNAGFDDFGRIVDVRRNPKAVPLDYDNYFAAPEKPKKEKGVKNKKTKAEKQSDAADSLLGGLQS